MSRQRLYAALQGAAILGLLMYAAMLTVMSGDIDAISISATCGLYAFVAIAIILFLSEGENE